MREIYKFVYKITKIPSKFELECYIVQSYENYGYYKIGLRILKSESSVMCEEGLAPS